MDCTRDSPGAGRRAERLDLEDVPEPAREDVRIRFAADSSRTRARDSTRGVRAALAAVLDRVEPAGDLFFFRFSGVALIGPSSCTWRDSPAPSRPWISDLEALIERRDGHAPATLPSEDLGESLRRVGLAMRDEDLPRRLEPRGPSQQLGRVRVSGEPVELLHRGAKGNVLAMEAKIGCAVGQRTPAGAGGLESDEQDRVACI